ncbi:TetR/AcrR family transcriptional regulator [Alkaliphilus oremlandii]|uniref:Transcriptional regulator, TetR family n=1 Tax=Alkaliphilus oremlandii (strain OhILAs) TaxID=350688 RepID=A8MG83_ALKOO|nr:TetR-like C-terminal domain-containing protein [Alkaliphilus oremlandii]ABW18811.1 transcriptional regulator, TetR family [Alkaliphilus oremlandii OhILAs]
MRKIKESRKTRYTRMALQNSLLELMEKKPIAKITIKELCENADINRTTFYAHYADQYDLLQKIEDETFSWVKESLTNLIDKADQYESMEILEGIFQHFVENRNHLQILMSEKGNINFQKELISLIYQQCMISPSTTAYTNMNFLEDYFVFVVSGSIGLIQHWFKSGLNKSAKEMSEIIYKMASSPMNLVELQRKF